VINRHFDAEYWRIRSCEVANLARIGEWNGLPGHFEPVAPSAGCRFLHRNDIGSLTVQFLEPHPDLASGEIGAKAEMCSSGKRMSAIMPWLMAFRVVSFPAADNRVKKEAISAEVSR
jgi:hypothetical protein